MTGRTLEKRPPGSPHCVGLPTSLPPTPGLSPPPMEKLCWAGAWDTHRSCGKGKVNVKQPEPKSRFLVFIGDRAVLALECWAGLGAVEVEPGRRSMYAHFTDEEPEAQSGSETCSGLLAPKWWLGFWFPVKGMLKSEFLASAQPLTPEKRKERYGSNYMVTAAGT